MNLQNFREELQQLSQLKVKVMQSFQNAPEGRMRCEMAQGKYPQYYVINEETKENYPQGKYLHKEEKSLAKAYAQKEYDKMMLSAISKREKELKGILTFEESSSIGNIFENLPIAKRCLIENYLESDADFERSWLQSTRNFTNTYPIEKGIMTERGEQVRSKSEKMIADKLYMKNVPYKYEAGLLLSDNRVIFPDFTLLNRRTREEYYLEHFGMMDNPEYCKSALEKIELYEREGIFLGERLLATFESSFKSINMKEFEKLIERIF